VPISVRKIPKGIAWIWVFTLLLVTVAALNVGAILFWPRDSDILVERKAFAEGMLVAEIHLEAFGNLEREIKLWYTRCHLWVLRKRMLGSAKTQCSSIF
jgi:hypothetical protein